MCVGLPMVTFEEGVDGLQRYDNEAFLIAKDWIDFSNKVLLLMEDEQTWLKLREGALSIASTRFTSEQVFREFLID
jgi:glycosyltransferase involved in cell wall biosynthesis